MNHSEFSDEAKRSNGLTAGEVPPISKTLPNDTQVTSSSPLKINDYDPYTLALRIVSILFLLCLLFVAALYYGVINP